MSIASNINEIVNEIEGYSQLIAVSKTFSQDKIREAYAAGVRDFGENYLDESLLKIEELQDLKDLVWHYQGRIQTKKINKIVGNFNFIHTLASVKHLKKIDAVAEELGIKQRVLVQVKDQRDLRDYALGYKDLEGFLSSACLCKSINLAGLMYLPPQSLSSEQLILSFQDVKHNFDKRAKAIRTQGHDWNMISMGMSGDYFDAAKNGATHVRVGSKIFGNRK